MIYLTEELHVGRDEAKVWPVSHYDRGKEGKRISKHPLNDTFIGKDAEQRRDAFYEQTKRGSLVAELDEPREVRQLIAEKGKAISQPIERVQKVFTMKLESLENEWRSIAKAIKSKDE